MVLGILRVCTSCLLVIYWDPIISFFGKKYFNRVGWTGHKGMSDKVCSSPGLIHKRDYFGLIHSKRCRTLSRNTDFSFLLQIIFNFLLQIMNMSQNRSPPDPHKRCRTLSGNRVFSFQFRIFILLQHQDMPVKHILHFFTPNMLHKKSPPCPHKRCW